MPSLYAPYEVAKYCERNGIRFIVDIQDLWPEAFELVFNVPVLNKFVYYPFRIIADGIYKRADSICAVSETYAKRAMKNNRKCKKEKVVYLGTQLKEFDLCNENVSYIDKRNDELWIAYCGTLGNNYDLTSVINSLGLIKDKGKKEPKLIVMGDGPLMTEFEKLADKLEVNCIFTGRMPYNEMCSLLKKCDITVNPIMNGSACSIINKHADYLASGLPMVSTQDNMEFNKLLDKYEFGIKCLDGSVNEISNGFLRLMNDEDLRRFYGKNARRCAEENFDREITYGLLINTILNEDDGDDKL